MCLKQAVRGMDRSSFQPRVPVEQNFGHGYISCSCDVVSQKLLHVTSFHLFRSWSHIIKYLISVNGQLYIKFWHFPCLPRNRHSIFKSEIIIPCNRYVKWSSWDLPLTPLFSPRSYQRDSNPLPWSFLLMLDKLSYSPSLHEKTHANLICICIVTRITMSYPWFLSEHKSFRLIKRAFFGFSMKTVHFQRPVS
jgi:hypothetical protein